MRLARPTCSMPRATPCGDLVLAAQERVGSGRVVVLGDASCFSNDRLPASYPFAVRMLACLADKSPSPQDGWRQALGLLTAAALVGLLIVRPGALRIAVAVVALAVSLACVAERNASTAAVLPDGRRHCAQQPGLHRRLAHRSL